MATKTASPKLKGVNTPKQVVKNTKDVLHGRPNAISKKRGGFADPEGEYLSERLKRVNGKVRSPKSSKSVDEDGK